MANYGNGLNTRNLIIQTSSKLFYEKGVEKTSITDIAKESHVYRTSIFYHFKSKDSINREIVSYSLDKLNEEAQKMTGTIGDNLLVCSYIFWYKFLNDANFQRFALYSMNTLEPTLDEAIGFFSFLRQTYPDYEYLKETDDDYILTWLAASNVERMMCQFLSDNPEYFSFEEAAEYETTIVSRIFSIPEEMIQSLIREMREQLSTVDFSKLDHALL